MQDALSSLLTLAKSRNVMLTTAESCTGGKLAAALTELPGSSAMFDRGFVTYTNEAKQDLLGVKPTTLIEFGAVSPEVAIEMARGALAHSNAQIAVSITGIAGPGGTESKPEGRVCFAVATANSIQSKTVEFGTIGRANVRHGAVLVALDIFLETLSEPAKL